MTMIIDFHTHCFPDHLYQRAIATVSKASKVYPTFDGSVGGLLRSCEQAGIDKAVVANIATNAKQTTNVNNFAIECNRYDRLISFGSIHPDFENWKEEIDKLAQNKIKGLKFHSHYQNFNIDDSKMMKVYEYALSYGMVLLFHTGEDRGINDNGGSSPKRMRAVVDAFKTPKIVAAHMGGVGYWDEMEKQLLGQELSFDTSFAFTAMEPERIERIIQNHNTDYILFATDAPWAYQADELLQYYHMNIPQKILEKILGKNAETLLGL